MTINLPQHRNYPARTLNPNPPKSDRLLASLEHLGGLRPGSAAARRVVADDPDLATRYVEVEKLRNALESRDDLYLHLTVGGDRGQWQEWLRLTDEDAELSAIARMMTALRIDLGESDWIAFRRYLLSASTGPDLDFSFSMSPACDSEIMKEWDRQRIQHIQRNGFTRESGDLGRDGEDLSSQLEHWRFLARFEVLPNGDRMSEVVWSPVQVPQWWMNVLKQNLALSSDKPGDHRAADHRVTVYAVVEVGKTVTVRQRMSFSPRCCCANEGLSCV